MLGACDTRMLGVAAVEVGERGTCCWYWEYGCAAAAVAAVAEEEEAVPLLLRCL